MADNLTTQSATPATIPASTLVATVDSAGSDGHVQRILNGGGETCTGSNVSASATSVTVLSSNTQRLGASLFNDSNSVCYVKCGTTASATDFVVKMGPGSFWEVPFGYRGRIDGIWVTATGSMRVAEFT